MILLKTRKKGEQRWNLNALASGAAEKNQLVQFVILLHMIGEESLDIYITFTFSQDEVNEIQPLFQKFERKILHTKERDYLETMN